MIKSVIYLIHCYKEFGNGNFDYECWMKIATLISYVIEIYGKHTDTWISNVWKYLSIEGF